MMSCLVFTDIRFLVSLLVLLLDVELVRHGLTICWIYSCSVLEAKKIQQKYSSAYQEIGQH